MNQKKYFKRTKLKAKGFVKSLGKKMLDIEKYMESFKESMSKRFEKQEENFKNLTDKVKNLEVTQREYKEENFKKLTDKVKIFEVTQKEYTMRLSRLENQRNVDENEDIELQQVKIL